MSRWDTDKTLPELFSAYFEAVRGVVADNTLDKMQRPHADGLLIPFFGTAEGITAARIATYGRTRLAKVKRKTLQKERSTLRGFLGWCHEQGHCVVLPEFPSLPARAKGTPYEVRRRGRATEVTPEQCWAIIDKMPKFSRRTATSDPFPVQDRHIVAYSTGLRPSTIDQLSCPEHWIPGSDVLIIEDRIDKARFGRELPLSEKAQEALGRVARRGLIFGRHNYRRHIAEAAKAVLPPEKARTFCAYDFRHTRLTELAGIDLRGAMYHAGHKRISTTDSYVRTDMAAARKVLKEASGLATRQPGSLVALHHLSVISGGSAKKRGRTSTSFRTPEPESGEQVRLLDRALDIIDAAAGQTPPDPDAVIEFVRDALTADALGQLALGVLEGGPFALLHLVRLAELVVERNSKAAPAEAEET